MISICSLIYRSAAFADSTYQSLMEYTPHLHDGRARFFFVANDATAGLKQHLRNKRYPFVCQENKKISDEELHKIGFAGPEYIRRVYKGYNRAIKESDEELILINSDMQFSPGWLDSLENAYHENRIVTSTLVERWQQKFGSRETGPKYFVEADFGSHPSNFNKSAFYTFSHNIKGQGTRPGRHYACVMMNRSKALEAGLYPEGNLFSWYGTAYGDQVFFARLNTIGVEHVESVGSIVYHFNEGEMEDTV